MGVTIVVCAVEGCGRMLNGELCHFIGKHPYCNEHFIENEPDTSDLEFAERAEQDKQDFFDRSRGVGQ